MEPKDWLQLGLDSGDHLARPARRSAAGRQTSQAQVKKVPAIPTSRNPIQSYQGVP